MLRDFTRLKILILKPRQFSPASSLKNRTMCFNGYVSLMPHTPLASAPRYFLLRVCPPFGSFGKYLGRNWKGLESHWNRTTFLNVDVLQRGETRLVFFPAIYAIDKIAVIFWCEIIWMIGETNFCVFPLLSQLFLQEKKIILFVLIWFIQHFIIFMVKWVWLILDLATQIIPEHHKTWKDDFVNPVKWYLWFCLIEKIYISFDYVHKLAFSKDNFGIPVFLDFDVGKYRKDFEMSIKYSIQNLNCVFQNTRFHTIWNPKINQNWNFWHVYRVSHFHSSFFKSLFLKDQGR